MRNMNEFHAIVERLRQARSILIITHARPDGDTLGSAAALAGAARSAGKTVHVLVPDASPERYDFLFPDAKLATIDQFDSLAGQVDLVVVEDTCSIAQLDGLGPALAANRQKVVVVDHHTRPEDIGSVRWIDTSAAAAGVMVMELLEELNWPIQGAVAEALMTAITTDTGWLHFANTDARCLRAVAKLLETGIRPDQLFARLFQVDRPERLRLMQRMLGSLELHCGNRLAVMCIRKADFAATGARGDETENLVNEALRMGCVDSSALLVENGEVIRVSLRSRDAVDVAAIAQKFGGGGHARAAGVRISEDIDAVKGRLVKAFEEAFTKASPL